MTFHLVCPQCVEATIMQQTTDPSGNSLQCPKCALVVRFEAGHHLPVLAEDVDDRQLYIWDQQVDFGECRP